MEKEKKEKKQDATEKLYVKYAKLQIQLEQTVNVAEQLRRQKIQIYQQIANMEK